jgi:hypothetical protein
MSIEATTQALAAEHIATPAIAVLATVAVLAVVQSLFGVGLLLFGTPTLLLLGLPFQLVLIYLLPCSIVVSALQVLSSGGPSLEAIRRQFLAITVPAVMVASGVALVFGSPHQLRTGVGAMLLLTALLRLGRFQPSVARFVRQHLRPLMLGLGIVHGLSNLGGGILTVIVGSCFEDKVSIRRHIAFAYGAMASIQLLVVFLTKRPSFDLGLWLLLPVLAGSTYLLLGQRVFQRAGQRPFQVGLTAMIMSFGVVLVASA